MNQIKNDTIKTFATDTTTTKTYSVTNSNVNTSNKENTYLVIGASLLLLVVGLYIFRIRRKNKKKDAKNIFTKQEHKIAELIVDNKTNTEISEMLFISNSTVKTHINNMYRKANISSRDELKKILFK
jgi:LPXTG-motif cell wall-anchored protein